MAEHRPDGLMATIDILARQWRPILDALTAACQGDASAAEAIKPILTQLMSQQEWHPLVSVLVRILDGERDPEDLLKELDATDAVIASNLLHALGVDISQVVPNFVELEAQPEAEPEQAENIGAEQMKLGDFVAMVAYACRPGTEPDVVERMTKATMAMSQDVEAEQEIRDLGVVLNQVMQGERQPDLSKLPEPLANLVDGMLLAMQQVQ